VDNQTRRREEPNETVEGQMFDEMFLGIPEEEKENINKIC